MEHTPLELLVDDEGVLWLAGELDMATAEAFLEMASANADHRRDVVLECSALTFLDSSGIRAILTLASHTLGKVIICNPDPPVRKVLTIAGVDEGMGVLLEPPSW